MSETKPENEETPREEPQFVMPDSSPAYALAERAVWHLLEKSGLELTVLDLRGRSDVCDFYVICTGNSKIQVTALAKHVNNMLIMSGQKPKGLEGMSDGRWALLDFFDVVIHVFKADAREYFNLERLWNDAARLDLENEHFAAAEVAARHPDLTFTTAAGPDGTA